MPIDYSKYPANWKTEIRPAILKRAGNRCEKCGVPNLAQGYRDKSGKFHALNAFQCGLASLCGHRVFRIVLTVAHLNHDRTDNRPENLAALCQRCNLLHDREQHRETRRRNREAESARKVVKSTDKHGRSTEVEAGGGGREEGDLPLYRP